MKCETNGSSNDDHVKDWELSHDTIHYNEIIGNLRISEDVQVFGEEDINDEELGSPKYVFKRYCNYIQLLEILMLLKLFEHKRR